MEHIRIIGGLQLKDAPIVIGAGVAKTPNETDRWAQIAAVMSGSYTRDGRVGNIGASLFSPETFEELCALGQGFNWFGMPNVGFRTASKLLGETSTPHPRGVSVAGFSADEYMEGVEIFRANPNISVIELNFGCPNTEHGKIMSFDLRGMEEVLTGMTTDGDLPIWAKVSPYSDPGLLAEAADVFNKSCLRAVVTCNTFPNAYAGKENISSPNGLAGLSGPALKAISLGQVVQFRQLLENEIAVVGIGGIATGSDVVEFLQAGASGVQLTSMPFWLGDPGKFWETLLDEELETYLAV